MRVVKQILSAIGPIILSALSILITFFILQPLALKLDPRFNLLANRGIGKVAFIFLAIYQIFLLLIILPKSFFNDFIRINFSFFIQKSWIKDFFKYFSIFFSLHVLLLILFLMTPYVQFNYFWGYFDLNLILKLIWGFIVVFFLAWSEELIFRGTIYLYLARFFKPIAGILVTSIIFMFVHDLSRPVNLITENWHLGMGLFLLGVLLNIIFVITRKLYTGMGAHAGLVFVKVILRRIPIIMYLSASKLPFWIDKDLRMSPLVHLLFFALICIFFIKNRKKLIN
ncbi:CPBP family intramembrane metalloprotease [Candidatus Dependentiae bacterium]|nr:CPBP family intramembrane metalloprotease [Candidatus Dependentiae bacterium]